MGAPLLGFVWKGGWGLDSLGAGGRVGFLGLERPGQVFLGGVREDFRAGFSGVGWRTGRKVGGSLYQSAGKWKGKRLRCLVGGLGLGRWGWGY